MFTSSCEQNMWHFPPRRFPMERKWKSTNAEVAPKCPRCASSNTKFCYYNNYSLSQPRYFCKGCRRYWTKGGSLRDIPVGGGCRQSRRATSARVAHVESYSKNPNGFDTKTNDQPIADGDSENLDSIGGLSATNGSDTDLAVVFTMFLNQDSPSLEPDFHGQELPDESKELNNASNSSTPDGVKSDATIDGQKPADLIFQEPDNLLDGLLAGDQQRLQELIETDCLNAMGLQTLLSQEMVQDNTLWLWSDAEPAESNVAWQPTVQLKEVDPFPAVDDPIKNAANPLSDNGWTSFDPSAFEPKIMRRKNRVPPPCHPQLNPPSSNAHDPLPIEPDCFPSSNR